MKTFGKVIAENVTRLGHIFHVASLNERTSIGNIRDLVLSIADHGMKKDQPVLVEEALKKWIASAIKNRESQWETLKANCELEKAPEGATKVRFTVDDETYLMDWLAFEKAKLATFEYLYMIDGEFIEPIARGVTHNRRFAASLDAMTIQLVRARIAVGDDKLQPSAEVINDSVLAQYPDTKDHRFPTSDESRMLAVLDENLGKDVGLKKMPVSDLIASAIKLVANYGKSQTELRKIFGNKGVQLTFISFSDIYCRDRSNDTSLSKDERAEWKEIRFADRLTNPKYLTPEDAQLDKVNPDWLDISKFSQQVWQGKKGSKNHPGRRMAPQSTFERDNLSLSKLEEPYQLKRYTAEEFKAFIAAAMAGTAEKTAPPLARDTYQGLGDTHPCLIARATFKSVDKNSVDIVNDHTTKFPAYNAIFVQSDEVTEATIEFFTELAKLDDDTQVARLAECTAALTAKV